MAAYNSNAGAASYDPNSGTCSNVRCHGGKKTPVWGTDSAIIENLDCESCHFRPLTMNPPKDLEAITAGIHSWDGHYKHISIKVWDATKTSGDRLETFQPVNKDGTVHIGKDWYILFVATAHYADGSTRELVDVVKSTGTNGNGNGKETITPTYEVYFDTTEAWCVPVAQTTGYPELAHWWGWTKGRDYTTCTITATDPRTGVTGSVEMNVNNWGNQFNYRSVGENNEDLS